MKIFIKKILTKNIAQLQFAHVRHLKLNQIIKKKQTCRFTVIQAFEIESPKKSRQKNEELGRYIDEC
jgi:hypothetical protein